MGENQRSGPTLEVAWGRTGDAPLAASGIWGLTCMLLSSLLVSIRRTRQGLQGRGGESSSLGPTGSGTGGSPTVRSCPKVIRKPVCGDGAILHHRVTFPVLSRSIIPPWWDTNSFSNKDFIYLFTERARVSGVREEGERNPGRPPKAGLHLMTLRSRPEPHFMDGEAEAQGGRVVCPTCSERVQVPLLNPSPA